MSKRPRADVALADVNVLVALAWPNHHHHVRAREWFRQQGAAAWATTPITQSGFVRISSSRAAVPTASTPAVAVETLTAWTGLDGHVFWPDDLDGVLSDAIDRTALRGHRQITDAHLLSLAQTRGGRLATFDAKLRALLLPDFEHLVQVID